MSNLQYKLQKQYRMPNYDYSQEGEYFVTICSKDRKKILGKIENEKTTLSDIGKIIRNIWIKIPEQFKNIRLDKWVIMPNHIHGIIIIQRRNFINEILTNKLKTIL